jgi:hypothetical protein
MAQVIIYNLVDSRCPRPEDAGPLIIRPPKISLFF